MRLEEQQCEVMFDGMPQPVCGELFIAVHPGTWTNDSDTSLDESYTIYVTVTLRVAVVPMDRGGTHALANARDGLDAVVENVRRYLHMSYAVIDDANNIINARANFNDFIQPLKFTDAGTPQPKGPDWFSAVPEESEAMVGISQTLTFRDARRVQVIEEQT